jgi:hypothetical protein
VPALGDQVQVDLAERRKVAVWVVGDDLGQGLRPVRPRCRVGDGEPVVGHAGDRERGREHPFVHVLHRKPAAVGQHRSDRGRQRAQRGYDRPGRAFVRAEDRVGVVMCSRDDPVDLGMADLRGRFGLLAGFIHKDAAIESSGTDSQDGRCLAS